MTGAAQFHTVVTREPDGTTIEVIGELDTFAARKLRHCVDQVLRQGDRMLIFDLGTTSFLDSSGLGVLVDTLKHLRRHGGKMTLRNVPTSARRVLEVTGLTKVFAIDDGASKPIE